MKIFCLSQKNFDNLMKKYSLNDENIEFRENLLIVSIIGDNEGTKHYFKENKKNVLNLVFNDVVEDMFVPLIGTPEIATLKCFTEEQGKILFDFAVQHKNSNAQLCFVHCYAGISRSGAVGSFLNRFWNLDENEFKKNNQNIEPNEKVMEILDKYLTK